MRKTYLHKGVNAMTEATIYNAKKKRTDDKEKQEKIQKWIDILQGDPSLEEFEKILKVMQEL